MPKRDFAPMENRIVRLSDGRIGRAARIGPPDGPGVGRPGSVRAVRSSLSQDAFPVAPAETGRSNGDPWRSVLAFVMEGFAIYGASLHPTTAFPVHEMMRSTRAREVTPVGDRRFVAAEPVRSQPSEDRHAVVLDYAMWAGAPRSRHWTWGRSFCDTIVTLWIYWRREREIKRAVAALMECDDRTLRDLTIGGRSDIERAVRSSRDH